MRIKNNKGVTVAFALMIGVTIFFAVTTTELTIISSNPSVVAQSSSSSNKQVTANGTGIGNLKQIGKVMGKGQKIIANNTNIGNPHAFQNFTKEHKIKSSTPQSIKALPLHPQLIKAKNMTTSAGGGSSGNKSGG